MRYVSVIRKIYYLRLFSFIKELVFNEGTQKICLPAESISSPEAFNNSYIERGVTVQGWSPESDDSDLIETQITLIIRLSCVNLF